MSRTKYIVIRNWDKFQHYKGRQVPWIKFYTELSHSDEWRELSLNRRGILCGLWLEYASSRARLRLDTGSLSHRINGRVTMADLKALEQAGFITISSRPSLESVYTESRPSRARAEREEERDKETPLPPSGKNGKTPSRSDEVTDLPDLTPAQIAANVKRVKELQRKALK
jgi:hypothetical protein